MRGTPHYYKDMAMTIIENPVAVYPVTKIKGVLVLPSKGFIVSFQRSLVYEAIVLRCFMAPFVTDNRVLLMS